MNFTQEKKEAVKNLAAKIASFGFPVYIAESGEYGLFASKDGQRVTSFQIDFSWFSFSANHKSIGLGTGYRLTSDGECPLYNLDWLTLEFCEKTLNAPIYRSRRKSEKFIKWITLEEHMKTYNSSSRYKLITA